MLYNTDDQKMMNKHSERERERERDCVVGQLALSQQPDRDKKQINVTLKSMAVVHVDRILGTSRAWT